MRLIRQRQQQGKWIAAIRRKRHQQKMKEVRQALKNVAPVAAWVLLAGVAASLIDAVQKQQREDVTGE